MVTIRLSRTGAKKKPFYHIVVTDSRQRSSTLGIEKLGFFNPYATGQDEKIRLNSERIDYWLGQGAQTSARVATLLKEHGTSS